MKFAQNLSSEIVRQGINCNKLSILTGLSSSLLKSYCKGIKKPGIENMLKIADALNISADYLLGRDEPKKSPVIETEDTDILEIMAKAKKLNPKARQKLVCLIDDMICNPANLVTAERVKERA